MHRTAIQSGDILYRHGNRAEHAYLVLSGTMEMQRNNVTVRVSEGALVGFSALMDSAYGSTAIAVGDCSLLAFTRKEFRAMIRSNPDQATEIIDGIMNLLLSIVGAMERAGEPPPAGGG
jgi:CRP-like cAMP-binding protein